jgi:hypothetical protein
MVASYNGRLCRVGSVRTSVCCMYSTTAHKSVVEMESIISKIKAVGLWMLPMMYWMTKVKKGDKMFNICDKELALVEKKKKS